MDSDLDRLAATTRRWLLRSGAVLCYHNVSDTRLPAAGPINLPVEVFRMGVTVARTVGEVVPLYELVKRHHAGKSTAGLIAITFDDSYVSVLDVLVQENPAGGAVPVSLFVVLEGASSGTAFWWDRIEHLLEHLSPEEWREVEAACGLPPEHSDRWPEFGRHWPLREWIVWHHGGRLPAALDEALSHFERRKSCRTPLRPMLWTELERLATEPHIDIGLHTISHPVLPLLDDGQLKHEVSTGYRLLRDRIADAVPILAMPYGLFDRRTVEISRQSGMAASLSLANTTLRGYGPGDEIPRFCITRKETRPKLTFRLTGILERVRELRGGNERYPRLTFGQGLPSPVTTPGTLIAR